MSIMNLNEDGSYDSFISHDCYNDYSDLAENIKTQMVLYELNNYLKKCSYCDKEIRKMNRLKGFKFLLMILYCFMLFFEKPFWCYNKPSFWSTSVISDISEIKVVEECDKDVVMLGFYINHITYRMIEISTLALLAVINYAYSKTNLKYKLKPYKILTVVTNIFLLICFIDIIFGLIFNFYPALNFLFRTLLVIILNKNLRREWMKIFKVIWMTKSICFILLFLIIVFSLIAYILFSNEGNDFHSFFSSLDTMFVLVTTCNFPDVMLKTFPISKYSSIFFVSYLILNFIVFLSLLKALYFASYLELNKNTAIAVINKIRIDIMTTVEFQDGLKKHLFILNNKYLLSPHEVQRLKSLLNLSNVELENKKITLLPNQSDEDLKKVNKHPILKILRMKKIEIIVNMVNLCVTGVVFLSRRHLLDDIIQIAVCFYFLIEYFIYIRFYTLKILLTNKIMRSTFFILNFICFNNLMIIMLLELFDSNSDYDYLIDDIIYLTKPLLILRSIRLLFLLNLFQEYIIIFTTLRNMKSMFWNILATLFSFCLVFSTVSMTILGGKVKMDQYKNHHTIPGYYSYINFNSFTSSFLTCFSLMMVNNINILTDALSQPIGAWMKAYFSLFYFVGILMILNIFQTYILEMYIITKKSKKV